MITSSTMIIPISIHAPTRGATVHLVVHFYCNFISIHAPTRGATANKINYIADLKISIHAPTRGATRSGRGIGQVLDYFNPRSYKRSDCCSIRLLNLMVYFNPRSYKRSDGKNAQLSLYLSVIIIA